MRWVVVGAGSGGAVAAGRLAAEPTNEVVVVERGPDLPDGAVPAEIAAADFTGALADPSRTETLFVSRAGRDDRYRVGRGLGGSSAINAMVGLRGDTARYTSFGWPDVDEAWARVRVPTEEAADHELGAVDVALLGSHPTAARAPLTRRGGVRVTVAEAYLWPVYDRVQVVVGATAARIVFDGRRAVGVQTADGTVIDADRVVVAAGAIHSPALLLRSGVDTPDVGAGLRDHAAVTLVLELRHEARPGTVATGSYAVVGDTQLLALNHTGLDDVGRRHGALMVALMRPESAPGRIRLDAGDETAPPAVWFGPVDDIDRTRLRNSVRAALELTASPPFEAAVARVLIDDVGTPAGALSDDDAIDAWIERSSTSFSHATSTCAMGAVVDQRGAVRGYEGLYVCDASVFPDIPDVNTHYPTMMLAERLVSRWMQG